MNQLFQFAEIKRYYKWSLWVRPLLIYSLMTCFVAVTLTVCALVLLDKASINDASTIFITIIGAVAPVLAVIFGGRSYERSKGVRDDDDFASAQAATKEESLIDPVTSNFDNPLDLLRSMDLSGYEPRVADDKPQIG